MVSSRKAKVTDCATISSITRESASTIGTSLKSIISRYEQIKSKGFNEEDATQINDVTKALQAVGITAVDAQGQLRPIAEVLDELGDKWNSLTKNEQAYVTTTLAGTYQRNRLITLLDNYNDSLKNYEAALNSAGTAEQKFAIYQESTRAALDKFTATWEEMWQHALSSDTIKTIINLGTVILNLVDKIGLLPVALSTAFGALFLLNKKFQAFAISTIPIVLQKLGLLVSVENGVAIAANGAAISVKALSVAFGTLAPFIITAGIYGLVKVFDALIVTIDEQKEKIAEAKQEYESITSELSELNEELKTTNNRINELNSKDKLTLIEENELSKLKLTNEELQKRIALLEREQEIKEQQLAKETQNLYEKQFGKYDFSQQQIDEYINNAKITGNNAILLAEENNVSALIAAYKQFLDLKKEALSSGNLEDVEHFDDLLTEIEEKLINNAKELQKTKDILGSLKNPTEKQKQILDEIEQALNLINEIIIPDKTNENIKKNSESLQNYEDNLKQLNDTIDSVQSDLKTLNQVLDDVQNGQSLNAETVLDLIQKYPELTDAIHKTADGWTIEKDAIEILRKAKIEEARATIENQINSTKATLDNVSARVNAYGIEIAAIEDLKSAQQEASKLGFKKVFGENAFENIKFDDSTNRITVGDKITEWSKEEYDKIKQSFNEQKLANDTILRIGELKERSKKLLELLSDPNFGVSSSKSSSSKSSTEIYQAEINQFQQLEDALAKVNAEIERNQALTDIAEDKDKINLLSKRINLLKEEQKALHNINEARRVAIQQNIKELAGYGFDIYYDKNANELLIKNYNDLNTLVQRVAKSKGFDQEKTNELVKSVENLIEETLSWNDANRKNSITYIQINKEISDIADTIDEINKKIEENLQKTLESERDKLLYQSQNRLERLKEGTEAWNKEIQWQINYHKENQQQIAEEARAIDAQLASLDKTSDEYVELKLKRDQLAKSWWDEQDAIDALNKSLEEYNLNVLLNVDAFEKALSPLNEQLKELDYQLRLLDDSDISGKFNIISQQIDVTTQQIKLYEDELARLESIPVSERTKELSDRINELKDSLRQAKINLDEYNDSLAELNKQRYEDQLNTIKTVEDKLIQIIKKRYELEMEAEEERHKKAIEDLDKELDSYSSYINERLNLLKESISEEDYQRELSKLREEEQKIQEKINKLMLDDSLEARNKVVELSEEKAKIEEQIENLKLNHNREAQEKNLQKQLDDFEKYIEGKKSKEDEDYENYKRGLEQRSSDMNVYLEAQKALLEGVMYDVNGQLVSLTDAYISFENTFGEGMSILGDKIKNEFISKILEAQSAVQNLESIMSNYMNYGGSVKSGSSNPLGMSDEDFQTYLENKRLAEQSNSPVVKQALRNKNQQLRDKYGIEEDLFDYNTLLQMAKGYSEGGLVDYTGLAMVHGTPSEPEGFLKYDDLSNLLKVLDFTDKIIHRIEMPKISNIANDGFSFKIDNLIAINGNVTKETIPLIQNEGNKIIERLKNEFIKRGIYR